MEQQQEPRTKKPKLSLRLPKQRRAVEQYCPARPPGESSHCGWVERPPTPNTHGPKARRADRKSTRLNSSHLVISYAVFCLTEITHDIDRRGHGLLPLL